MQKDLGRGGAAVALLLALALATVLLPDAGAGSAGTSRMDAGPRFATAGEPEPLSRSAAAEYWTPERAAAAPGLELGPDGSIRPSSPLGPAAPGNPFASVTVDHPSRYPASVHGKLFGNLPGIGDFTCSATVVTSGAGSLITTAGHCAYDPGSGEFSRNLIFAPGFSRGEFPLGRWPVTNLITPSEWAGAASLGFDVAMMTVEPSEAGELQAVVGSRGLGFGQPLKQRLAAYGYPVGGPGRDYDGEHLIRCVSSHVPDRLDGFTHRGPASRGLNCDMQAGSSGGGFVAQDALVVSNVSHGHTTRAGKIEPGRLYGPDYGRVIKTMYRADIRGWPSIGPVRCQGGVADMIGTSGRDVLKGTKGPDVIATLGGGDKVNGGGGRDRICGGEGPDQLTGSGGRDTIDGGSEDDRCSGDRLRNCES